MRCRKIGIPIYAAECGLDPGYMPGFDPQDIVKNGQGVIIRHSEFDALPEKCWAILGHIGREIAHQKKMPIIWGGLEKPELWHLTRDALGD